MKIQKKRVGPRCKEENLNAKKIGTHMLAPALSFFRNETHKVFEWFLCKVHTFTADLGAGMAYDRTITCAERLEKHNDETISNLMYICMF